MRLVIVVSLLVFSSLQSFSQWLGIPRSVELPLQRIERAVRDGSFESVQDLFAGGITMRLEDSLYQMIPSMYALDRLKVFFADKDSIDFRFGLPGSGSMYYTSNNRRDTVKVDVWLKRNRGEVFIYALNISNYPTATVFYNIHHKEKNGESQK